MNVDECELECKKIIKEANIFEDFVTVLNLIHKLDLPDHQKTLLMLISFPDFLKNIYKLNQEVIRSVVVDFSKCYLKENLYKIEPYHSILFAKSKNDILKIPQKVYDTFKITCDQLVNHKDLTEQFNALSEDNKDHIRKIAAGILPNGYIIGD